MSAIASSSKSKKSKTNKSHHKRTTKARLEDSSGKNEGRDPNWEYQPPPGVELIDSTNEEYGEFDWDAVNEDEDVEIWIMRVPESVKPKHLEGLSFDLDEHTSTAASPSRKKKRRTTLIGSLKRKHNSYDIWALGDDHDEDQSTESSSLVGGDEMKSLSCLLPRKSKNGKLYAAPKPIARHIVVSAQPAQPSMTTDSASTEMVYTNPPREKYPPELLTHRFMPCGSLAKTSTDNDEKKGENTRANALRVDSDAVMADLDSNFQSDIVEKEEPTKKDSGSKKKKDKMVEEEEGMDADDSQVKEKLKEKKEKKSSGKKRKGEEDVSPKKTKKAKTASA